MLAAETLTVEAYGKINWTLDVLGKRADGYHEIASVMQQIMLSDILTFKPIPNEISLTITGPEAGDVPNDQRNIVWQAAALLEIDGVEITIEKHLPSQAGLGGGSSDGAAALTALNRLFDKRLDNVKLQCLAAELGADVSFFLQRGPARAEGFGEKITALGAGERRDVVIIKPDIGVSTVDAYRVLDRVSGRTSRNATRAWPNSQPSNDFEDIVFDLYPAVDQARQALLAAGATSTLLCGSGAAVMAWGDNAGAVYNSLRSIGHERVWLTRTMP
jgi:4-diphosphocytidyl-2-C-methyl-D-erythritol kinase